MTPTLLALAVCIGPTLAARALPPVRIEIVPDRSRWYDGEHVTGRVVVHNVAAAQTQEEWERAVHPIALGRPEVNLPDGTPLPRPADPWICGNGIAGDPCYVPGEGRIESLFRRSTRPYPWGVPSPTEDYDLDPGTYVLSYDDVDKLFGPSTEVVPAAFEIVAHPGWDTRILAACVAEDLVRVIRVNGVIDDYAPVTGRHEARRVIDGWIAPTSWYWSSGEFLDDGRLFVAQLAGTSTWTKLGIVELGDAPAGRSRAAAVITELRTNRIWEFSCTPDEIHLESSREATIRLDRTTGENLGVIELPKGARLNPGGRYMTRAVEGPPSFDPKPIEWASVDAPTTWNIQEPTPRDEWSVPLPWGQLILRYQAPPALLDFESGELREADHAFGKPLAYSAQTALGIAPLDWGSAQSGGFGVIDLRTCEVRHEIDPDVEPGVGVQASMTSTGDLAIVAWQREYPQSYWIDPLIQVFSIQTGQAVSRLRLPPDDGDAVVEPIP